jgi:hypothetical protein
MKTRGGNHLVAIGTLHSFNQILNCLSSQTPTEKINNLISRFESVIHKMNTQQTPMSRVRVRGISYADKNLISRVCGPLKYLLHIKSVSKTQRG